MSDEELETLQKEYNTLKEKNDNNDKKKDLKEKIRKEKARASPWRGVMKDLGQIFGPK